VLTRHAGGETSRIDPIVAPRFVVFGVACSVWLAVIMTAPSPALHAAGLSWFVNWGVQIAVSVVSWMVPVSLPASYYRAGLRRRGLPLAPWFGLDRFGRVARWLHPLPFNRRFPGELEAAMAAAETTHAITFVVVTLLAVGLAERGSATLALLLVFWNMLFNLYPAALQRHNRGRLEHLRRSGPGQSSVRHDRRHTCVARTLRRDDASAT
jgi:hypothetical protein